MGTEKDSTTETVDIHARMQAQCRQIEQYRLAVMRDQGRRLSADEAALEWIANYAEEFAGNIVAPEQAQ